MKICFKLATMKTIIFTFRKLAFFIFVVICLSNCSKESEYLCNLVTRNNTNSKIYIETTLNDNTTQIHIVNTNELYGFTIGYISKENGEDYPSVSDVSQKLQHIQIYRKISDSIQFLPKHFYDEANDFSMTTDYFMGTSEANYFLKVTEEMFEE